MPAGFAKRIGQPHRTRGDPVIVPQDDIFLRKEVIQPQVPLRLPCYDLVPITEVAFGAAPLAVGQTTSGALSFHDLTGGVYKAQEHIHRGVADPRLLAIPTSCRRVAADNPNWGRVSGICSTLRIRNPLSRTIVARV
jgi:hypothetical protein